MTHSSPEDVAWHVPVEKWNRESASRALDELFSIARKYNSSRSYFDLLQFIGRLRSYSPFNAALIHTQMEGARYVATPNRWRRDFRREIKFGARPILILQPMGPVLFVIDVSDTEPLPGAPALPREVERPFEVHRGTIGTKLERTIENAKRDGVRVIERAQGSQRAGSIQETRLGNYLDVLFDRHPPTYQQVPLRYELLLNSNLSREARYATLVHELGHLYCGHLGTPDAKFWPDRQWLSLDVREFEAESICYLVCARLGIDNPSAQYLAGYVQKHETTPPISLDCALKAAWLIERMGREHLRLRKATG